MNEQEKKEEGARLFREAEKYRLGKDGFEVDYNKAKELYEQAIEHGNPIAMNNLAWLYQEGNLGDKPDYDKAKELLEQAIEGGNANAMYNLACLYHEGNLGDKPDYDKAKELFEKAIERGNASAMNNLAWLYQEGKLGDKADYIKAKELYEQAIEHGGIPNSMCHLGWLYRLGHLGDENIHKATDYFAMAKKTKNPIALSRLPNPLVDTSISPIQDLQLRKEADIALTKLEQVFFDIRDEHRMKRSIKLAHFTAWPAIESILSLDTAKNPDFSEPVTNCLRQYHVDYMNDPTEGHRLLKPDDETGKMLKDLFEKHYFNVFKTHQATTDLLPSMFTVSLTKETDRLDLWRAYGRDGAGFSLSLNIECLEDQNGEITRSQESAKAFLVKQDSEDDANTSSFKANLAPPLLYEVKYKDEDVKATLDKLNAPLLVVHDLQKELEPADWQRVASCATAILLELLYLYKDEQYCNEHEVRALRTLRIDDEAVKLDERTPGRLYCETSPFLFRTPDSEIIVGPKVENKEAALWNIRHRLAKLGLSPNTIVKESALKYR